MSRGMWKAVETKIGKVRIAKAKERRKKRKGREETRREGDKKETEEEKTEKRKSNRYKKSSGRVGDLEGKKKSYEVGRRGEKVGSRNISQVD